jgi:hypothetical protein
MKQYFRSYFQKISITSILLLFAFFIDAHENEKQLKFEQKLNNFRYSLYEAIDTIENFNKLLDESNAWHPVVKKVEVFMAENKQQIISYREYQLGKYINTKIDFEYFRSDNTFDATLDNQGVEFWNKMAKISALTELMSIDPLFSVNVLINSYLSSNYTVSEMGRKVIKDKIASPKILTKKQNNTLWKIWVDQYDNLFELSYEPETNKIRMIGLFHRTKK